MLLSYTVMSYNKVVLGIIHEILLLAASCSMHAL